MGWRRCCHNIAEEIDMIRAGEKFCNFRHPYRLHYGKVIKFNNKKGRKEYIKYAPDAFYYAIGIHPKVIYAIISVDEL